MEAPVQEHAVLTLLTVATLLFTPAAYAQVGAPSDPQHQQAAVVKDCNGADQAVWYPEGLIADQAELASLLEELNKAKIELSICAIPDEYACWCYAALSDLQACAESGECSQSAYDLYPKNCLEGKPVPEDVLNDTPLPLPQR